jgi:TonB-dependent starch-binding outer membrane protein SusC
MQFSYAQEKTITGKVSDESGPLPGVNVVVKRTQRGVSSGFDGGYSIKARVGETLVFSFLGMNDVSRIVGDENVISVKMSESSLTIAEVVVVAYGKQDKKKTIQSVSSVNAEKIKDVSVASVQDILQGQTSGVQVVNSSGVLGSAPVVKIRGVASLTAGGRPLYVMDGVPLNDENLTATQGGQSLNPLVGINQNDIESLTVLKDAAATAIYGSRGSNGVILITTKSGKKNQAARVTVGFNTSVTNATDLLPMMDADQYRAFIIKTNPTLGLTNADVGLDSFDWIDAVSRSGVSIGSDVNLSGGTEKTTYAISGTYANQEGFIVGNGLRRNGARINLTTEANDWIKVGMNLGISEVLIDRVGSENNTAAPFTSAYLQEPVITPFDSNGNYVNLGFIQNVVAIEKFDINTSNTFRLTGNVFGEFKINKNLKYRTDFGLDRDALEEFTRSFEVNTAGGSATDYQAVQNKYVFTNNLEFSKKFNDVHDFNVLGGVTIENTSRRDISVAGTGFASDDLINVTSAVSKTTTDNSTTASRLVGLFSRMSYAYSNKYLAELSFRRDGSSKFGSAFQYGNFWSVGAGWVVSEENFLKDNSYVNNLKIKANYGVAGNDRIGDFVARENTSGGVGPNYNQTSGLAFFRYENPELRWEKSKAYDIGIEVGAFNNRIRLAVDYYNKKTEDLILPQSLSVAENLGINTKTVNAGTMENKGFDFDLSVDILRETKFKWTTSLNMNFNKNTLLSLNESAAIDLDGNRFVAGSVSQRAIVGYSVNTFFVIPYLGVNPETGNAEWLGRNGLPTTTPTANDRAIVGDANPDFTGGFSNNFKYGNWDLSSLINFSHGNDIFIDGLRFTEDARYNGFNKSSNLLNLWQNPGDIAETPSVTSPTFSTFQQRSSKQLRDGSFARLKSLTLGYNLSFDNSPIGKLVKSLRLYVTGQNLFTVKADNLDGIDPEVTNSIANGVQGETFFTAPQSKTYLFGARLTF